MKRLVSLLTDQYRFFIVPALFLLLLPASCTPRAIQPPRPLKTALVLGAGASRGFAHIGVLKVLEANGVPVDMIVGTSAGSFVGSLYAYGYSAFQLQEMSLSLQRYEIIDFGIPDKGFVKGEKIEEYINGKVKSTLIEHLKLPFYAVATDIGSGQEMIFSSGNTGLAVRASSSIPGIFRPVKIGDMTYADGGIVSPVAVNAARQLGADIVIAVDISSDLDTSQPEGTVDMILKSVTLMHSQIASSQLANADVVIRPAVGYIGAGDFTRRHDAILEGEKATTAALPEIQRVLTVRRHEGR